MKFTRNGATPLVVSAETETSGAALDATPLPENVSWSTSNRALVGPPDLAAATRYRRWLPVSGPSRAAVTVR